MKLLMIGLDKNLFIDGSESQKRMIEYGGLSDSLDIIVFTKRGFHTNGIAYNTTVWPTNSLSRIFYIFDGFTVGRNIIKQRGADVIIAQDPLFTGFVAFVLSIFFSKKLLVSVYGNNVYDVYWRKESLSRRFLAVLGSFILKGADAIQSDGPETVEELAERFPGKVFWKPVVPSDLDSFARQGERLNGEVRIIFTGRMVKQKNIPLLVEVIERVSKKKFDKKVSFTVIGDGPYSGYFSTQLAERKIPGVRCIKKVSREEYGKIISRQDILILTSFYEGFPRVFMEAAHGGIPIVTTRVSGVKNLIIDGKSGFVVGQNNSEEFVAKLSELIEDDELLREMSKNIKERFEKNFPPGCTVHKQKEVLDYLGHLTK